MSAWAVAVRELYERGPLSTCDFWMGSDPGNALQQAKVIGLVRAERSLAKLGQEPGPLVWHLTKLGSDFATGRAGRRRIRRDGNLQALERLPTRLGPTWLAALPDGLRLTPRLCSCHPSP